MSSQASRDDLTGPLVTILEETEAFNYRNHFCLYQARLQYRRADGSMGEPVTRLNFERGNAAAVLLYDRRHDAVVLVRQFRYPVYASLPASERQGQAAQQAWLLEIIAGVEEEGQSSEEAARREAQEEAGFEIRGALERIADVYTTPGSSSERVTVFLAEVDSEERAGEGGGLAAEGEEVELVVLPRGQALDMLQRGEIRDAKTVISLQYLAHRLAAGS